LTLIPLFTSNSIFRASGGTEYTQGGYKYHKFTSDGSFIALSGNTTLEFIAVGGGGAGGTATPSTGSNYSYAGGGGGGGVVYNTYPSNSLSITIGLGGTVTTPDSGGTTQILTIPSGMGSPALIATANGGGYGASPNTVGVAANGASGGGAGIKLVSGVTTNYSLGTGDGTTGFNGGAVISGAPSGGGGHGGGAASAGGTGPTSGGLGITTYSSWFNDGTSSLGSGGIGGYLVASPPIVDYGDGGAGGASYTGTTYTPYDGTAGVVVVRYAV
jgi:hypothetical protein